MNKLPASSLKSCAAIVFLFFFMTVLSSVNVSAGGNEYSGQFDTALVPNAEDLDRVYLKSASFARFRGHMEVGENAHFAAGQLMNPQTQQSSLLAVLTEEEDKDPVLFVDLNNDYNFTNEEKFVLKQSEKDDPYLWETIVNVKLNEGTFKTCPIFVQYFRSVRTEKMGPDDRLLMQSTVVLARGQVDVHGKTVLVQYAYDIPSRKVDPQNGMLGVDTDGDGKIDLSTLSPEATEANNETVVFRASD